jgi:hypothetical protein
LHEINVKIVVVIEIEECRSGTHDLRQVKLSRHAVVVLKVESGLCGDFSKDRCRG